MKIALLSDGVFPYVVGGMQKHTYYLAKYFARAGVYVDLYVVLPAGVESVPSVTSLFTVEEQSYITLTPVPRAAEMSFPGHYVWESFQSSERIWDALKSKLDVDFIYAQGFAGWKTMLMKRKTPGMPLVGVNFHGFEMWQMPASMRVRMEQWLLRPFVKTNVALADVVLLLGDKLGSVVTGMAGKNKVTLNSANGVTPDWLTQSLSISSRPLRFVFMGRYERRKGIEELHRTIQWLTPRFDFNFDIIGPIPEHLQLNSHKVKYWGLVRQEAQIRAILKQSDVLVCPSYAEGMPTVILEAMASGLAVIATNVGAIGDLVSEENGWIIPAGEQEALQQAMVEAITGADAALASKMTASYNRVRETYLWPQVVDKTISEIKSVVGDTTHTNARVPMDWKRSS